MPLRCHFEALNMLLACHLHTAYMLLTCLHAVYMPHDCHLHHSHATKRYSPTTDNLGQCNFQANHTNTLHAAFVSFRAATGVPLFFHTVTGVQLLFNAATGVQC